MGDVNALSATPQFLRVPAYLHPTIRHSPGNYPSPCRPSHRQEELSYVEMVDRYTLTTMGCRRPLYTSINAAPSWVGGKRVYRRSKIRTLFGHGSLNADRSALNSFLNSPHIRP